MAIRVVPYEPEHVPLVKALNRRLAEGGSTWAFYEQANPEWLEPGATPNTQRDFYVALDDEGVARGGYALKPEVFLLRGKPIELASIQGPVSEGLVNAAYSPLAFQLIRDMESRSPNLFSWGASDRVLELFRRLKWREHRMPFQLRVVRPARFLRRNAFLRKRPRNRWVLDLLAYTGVGAAAIWSAQAALTWSGRGNRHRLETVEVDSFGSWADEIWAAAAPQYELIAIRDRDTMNARLPRRGWFPAYILQITRGAQTMGWAAVFDTEFEADGRFGSLRVGSIIDALAHPGSEAAVLKSATAWLERRGVDAVVSNFTHPTWQAAFRQAGYFSSADRRPLTLSWDAAEAVGEDEVVSKGLHMTPIDGDGPRGL
jgi:hypothetical protein